MASPLLLPRGLPLSQICFRARRPRESFKVQEAMLSLFQAECNSLSMGGAAVVYHYPCPDGVFAALAAHLYHKAVGCPVVFYPNTVFSPLRVKDLALQDVDMVYLLDFAGHQGFAEELAQQAKEVIVLDHHKTALDLLPSAGEGPQNLLCLLDMNRSGATISYDYFTEKLSRRSLGSGAAALSDGSLGAKALVPDRDLERVETLFRYIEDADLWRWNLPNSKAFSSGIKDLAIEFNASVNPKVFDQLLALVPEDVISGGKDSLRVKQRLIDRALQSAFELKLGGGKFGTCLGVRADSIAHLRSELGNQLAAKSQEAGLLPVGAVVYTEPALYDNRILKISLRSLSEAADTTRISQAYGGGGHLKASSFLLTKEEFQEWQL